MPSDSRSETHLEQDDEALNYLKLIARNPKRLNRIKFLRDLFKTNGYELKIAGGAVRDIVNGKEPVDIDLATDAHPEETLKLVNKHPDLLRVIVTGAGQRHGTVAVKFKEVDEVDLRKRLKLSDTEKSVDEASGQVSEPKYDEESPYEITTLRCDVLTDGRHARVEFVNNWKIDAERRDLTINSMFLNLDDGNLVDYFGGEQDCKNNVIKFVGDADRRIKEDYLRILRYFRFWLRYSRDQIFDDQIEAIKSNLDGLKIISGERIWVEFKKIFAYLSCSKVVKLMLDLELFKYINLIPKDLPNYQEYCRDVLEELEKTEANVKIYRDEHLKDLTDPILTKRFTELMPTIIFSTCIQSDNQFIMANDRLKFSKLERDTITYLVTRRGSTTSIKKLKYELAMVNRPEIPSTKQRIMAHLVASGQFELIDEINKWSVPKFPLHGRIVAQALGRKKMPKNMAKEVIDELKLEWSKSDYQADEQELESKIETILDRIKAST